MKIIVDHRNYAHFDYDEYYDGGSPENNPYVRGQVVAIKEDNRSGEKGKWTLGVVLGVITRHEVRTDAHGMVPLEDIRPAVVTDFGKSNVKYHADLYAECQGLPHVRITKHSEDGKQESFWYDGQVAIVRHNGRAFSVEATGEKRIYIDKKGEGDFDDRPRYDGVDAVDKCRKLGFSDEDVNDQDKVYFDLNNWFAIRELDDNGDVMTNDEGICHTYDEAIELAKSMFEKELVD